VTNENFMIDISGLAGGVYLLSIFGDTRQAMKIIKQ